MKEKFINVNLTVENVSLVKKKMSRISLKTFVKVGKKTTKVNEKILFFSSMF